MASSSQASSESNAGSGSIAETPAGTNWTIIVIVGLILSGGLLWLFLRKKK